MIWEQLAELRKSCDVKLESHLDRQSQFGWRITITRRDRTAPPIIVTGPEMEEVVRKAIQTSLELDGTMPSNNSFHPPHPDTG